MNIPLAERVRPKSLAEYIGQTHLLGENAVLNRFVLSKTLPSLILWGPPGVGKTTLASLLAQELNRPFYALSAISSGVKDIRDILERSTGFFNPILFIDEIHRFSKSQQDALLGAVEKGRVTLLGATTENPSFEVNDALLSRCQVYQLESHGKEELRLMISRALKEDEVLSTYQVEIQEDEALLLLSGGDARRLLNLLEMAVLLQGIKEVKLNNELVKTVAKQQVSRYDKNGEQHYDVISAFIKSIRGSDPQAAIYYLARMLHGGEDPLFIARRLMILAAEDIGLADPQALVLSQSAFQAVHAIGMPEARIILSEITVYLASASKSNSAYVAINKALEFVANGQAAEVPLHLRNAPTKLMKEMGYGKDYKYAHDYPNHFVKQEFMPSALKGLSFYEPADNEKEKSIRARLLTLWEDKYPY